MGTIILLAKTGSELMCTLEYKVNYIQGVHYSIAISVGVIQQKDQQLCQINLMIIVDVHQS